MVLNPKVEKLYQQVIDQINAESLGTVEMVRKFRLLHEPWSAENGLLTPTLKLRRAVLFRQYQDEISDLFVG
jgi:long-chain acyl-CoA synthetase